MRARDEFPADSTFGGTTELREGVYERMCMRIDALSSRAFAKAVSDVFAEQFFDGARSGVTTLHRQTLYANIRHAVRFAIEDVTGQVPT